METVRIGTIEDVKALLLSVSPAHIAVLQNQNNVLMVRSGYRVLMDNFNEIICARVRVS